MAKSETHDKLIESVVDYKKGWTSLESAAKELSEAAGLTPGIAAVFLKNMKRNMIELKTTFLRPVKKKLHYNHSHSFRNM